MDQKILEQGIALLVLCRGYVDTPWKCEATKLIDREPWK